MEQFPCDQFEGLPKGNVRSLHVSDSNRAAAGASAGLGASSDFHDVVGSFFRDSPQAFFAAVLEDQFDGVSQAS